MSSVDIIRAWKDDEFRQSLSPEQQALLPENPAHRIELTDADLDQMQGGNALTAANTITFPCPTVVPFCPPTKDINCIVSVINGC